MITDDDLASVYRAAYTECDGAFLERSDAGLRAVRDHARAATLAEVRERMTGEAARRAACDKVRRNDYVSADGYWHAVAHALADRVCGPAGATTGEARPADEPAPPVAGVDVTDAEVRAVLKAAHPYIDDPSERHMRETRIGLEAFARGRSLPTPPAPSDSAVEAVASQPLTLDDDSIRALLTKHGGQAGGWLALVREVAESAFAAVLSLDGIGVRGAVEGARKALRLPASDQACTSCAQVNRLTADLAAAERAVLDALAQPPGLPPGQSKLSVGIAALVATLDNKHAALVSVADKLRKAEATVKLIEHALNREANKAGIGGCHLIDVPAKMGNRLSESREEVAKTKADLAAATKRAESTEIEWAAMRDRIAEALSPVDSGATYAAPEALPERVNRVVARFLGETVRAEDAEHALRDMTSSRDAHRNLSEKADFRIYDLEKERDALRSAPIPPAVTLDTVIPPTSMSTNDGKSMWCCPLCESGAKKPHAVRDCLASMREMGQAEGRPAPIPPAVVRLVEAVRAFVGTFGEGMSGRAPLVVLLPAAESAIAAAGQAGETSADDDPCPVDEMLLTEWDDGNVKAADVFDDEGDLRSVLDHADAEYMARQIAWLTRAVRRLGAR